MSRKRRHEDASKDGVFVYFEHTDVSSIPLDITSLRIDSSVKKIPPGTFEKRDNLKYVEYEEGLEVIGDSAFNECYYLGPQRFPSTLVEIGKEAFRECVRIELVGSLPLSLRIIRECAFYRCVDFFHYHLEIHDTVRLEAGVFQYCRGLSSVTLPRGMVTIPSRLFYACGNLLDVNIPSTVIEIGDSTFADCGRLSKMKLPTGLKTIGLGAFAQTWFKHFRCPATVENVGPAAFKSCSSLGSVILPPKLEIISESTFYHCHNLKYVRIPQSVVQVGDSAFEGCCSITQMDLSGLNLTSIGGFAFAKCSSLRDIMLPRTGLKRIEDRCFLGCSSLTHLWVPPTVEYIDNGAFGGCTSLLSVEVPETLKRLIFATYDNLRFQVFEYRFLVNAYISPSHQLDGTSRDEFMKQMKLGEAEDRYPELVGKLKRRFNDLPLHRACYFQSYHPLQENIRMIREFARDGPTACEPVDFLGMTPFHILALSHRPVLNLFQELLSVSSVDIMKSRDIFGATPIDYLCKNRSPEALCVTKQLLLTIMEPRISLLGLDSWRDDVRSSLEKAQNADATSLGAEVTSICEKLAMFEPMETLSLLEMSIWRMKVEKEKARGSDARESCRINCGGSIVLEHVIPFLRAKNVSEDDSNNNDEKDTTDESSDDDDPIQSFDSDGYDY